MENNICIVNQFIYDPEKLEFESIFAPLPLYGFTSSKALIFLSYNCNCSILTIMQLYTGRRSISTENTSVTL